MNKDRNTKIICISGKAGHGKDTVGAFLAEQLQGDVLITHYADLVKHICKKFFHWNGVKDKAGRTLMQTVGTDKVRTVYEDFWVNFIIDIVKCFPDEWDYVVIPDTRFENEIERWKEEGFSVKHVRVERRNNESALTMEQQEHISETALDHVKADVTIANYGDTEELKSIVGELVRLNTF